MAEKSSCDPGDSGFVSASTVQQGDILDDEHRHEHRHEPVAFKESNEPTSQFQGLSLSSDVPPTEELTFQKMGEMVVGVQTGNVSGLKGQERYS